MKVSITTGKDIRHKYFLKQAINRFSNDIVGIIIQMPTYGETNIQTKKKNSNPWLTNWIKLQYFIQSKRASLLERLTFYADSRSLSRYLNNIPVYKTSNINSSETLDFIKNHPAEMLVVFGGKIIKPGVIRQFPSGIVNLHLGLSPDYRGANCIEWPLYHQKPEMVGVTVHYIDQGIDSGKIIKQLQINPQPGKSPAQIVIKSYSVGINLLLDTCERIRNGEQIKAIPQEKRGFCYYAKHFTPEIRYGVYKRTEKLKSDFHNRLKNKINRESFNLLKVNNLYKRLFFHIPYPAILLYHDIGEKQSPYLKHYLTPTREQFREHIEVLGDFYNIVSVKDIYQAAQKGERLENTIAFSFDDGNRSVLDALAILKEKGYPATIYINSDFISGRDLLWRSKLSYLVEKSYFKQLKNALRDEISRKAPINRKNVFKWTRINARDPRVVRVINRVFSDYGDNTWKGIYLDWEEIKNVDRSLFKFGNHTKTHLCLSSLTPDQQQEQILEGQREIISHLGDDGVGFSIPFGEPEHYNAITLDFATRSHPFYLSSYGGLNVVGLGDELKRIAISDIDSCQLPRILWNNL